jgi:hypothetical protein
MPRIDENYINRHEIRYDDPVEVVFHMGKPLLSYYYAIGENSLTVYNITDHFKNIPEKKEISLDMVKDVIKLSRSKQDERLIP